MKESDTTGATTRAVEGRDGRQRTRRRDTLMMGGGTQGISFAGRAWIIDEPNP